MKSFIQILILSTAFWNAVESSAQHNHDYNWMFNQSRIDFSEDTVKIVEADNVVDIYISNATLSDSVGKFLGYTNGCYIANENYHIVDGSDSLNYNNYVFYEELCIDPGIGYINGYQGIVPVYYSDSIVLIHEKINFNEEDFFVFTQEFVFTSLKIEADSISMLSKEEFIVEDDSLGTGHLSAVKHENTNKWWILKHDLHSNCYYSILFDGILFNLERHDCLGFENTQGGDGGGGALFSPTGDKYARFNPEDALYIFDFSRESGELSNFRFIDIPKEGIFGGISFSPSGQFLYVSDRLHIRQYDVWTSDIAESEVVVAEYDGFIGNNIGQGTTFGQMQLAPDCRIYLNTGPALPYLHVIMKPDEKGIACDVRQHNITLPHPHIRSMPYFPNYRLGTDEPLCDSTKVIVLNGTTAPVSTVDLDAEVKVFPNPASTYLNILLEDNEMHTIKLFDIEGRLVLEEEIHGVEGVLDVRGARSGLYMLWIQHMKSGMMATERVVIE